MMVMMKNIIDKINSVQDIVTEEDAESWILPGLIEHYSSKITALARHTYGNGDAELVTRAFKEEALGSINNPGALRKGLYTFLFKSKHWRNGRDINTYLLTCLNRLSDKIKADIECSKKINVPICPACRVYKQKEFLTSSNQVLRCNSCSITIDVIENDLKKEEDPIQTNYLLGRLNLHKIFMVHTRRGFRCPDCTRFMPYSYVDQYGVSCPYSSCGWFGIKSELELMAHPTGLSSRNHLSLNANLSEDVGRDIWQDRLESNDLCAEDTINARETFKKEYDTLKYVIELQMKRAEKSVSVRSFQKVLMYQAYINILNKYPEDMVSYLVHVKHISGNSPIQARIFQEYVKQVENNLPFSILKGKDEIEIYSLQDPNLNLFLGISEFEAEVREDYSIPNNTKEKYIGSNKLKNYGPCFIGMLIDVIDLSTDKSIKESVIDHTFVKVNMNPVISPGTRVKIVHFRTFSHYEMGSLVILQRIRKSIVSSMKKRMNNEKS